MRHEREPIAVAPRRRATAAAARRRALASPGSRFSAFALANIPHEQIVEIEP
jgi:hypothetical protein